MKNKGLIFLLIGLIFLSIIVFVALLLLPPKDDKKPIASPVPTAETAVPGVPEDPSRVEWVPAVEPTATPAAGSSPTSSGYVVTMNPPADAKPADQKNKTQVQPTISFPGDAGTAVKEKTPPAKTVVEQKAPVKKEKTLVKNKEAEKTDKPAKTAAKTVNAKEFWIQVGAYKDRYQAENMGKEVDQQGLKSTLVTATVNGQTVIRVRVGPYENAEEAKKFLSWLTPVKGFENSFVTQADTLKTK